MKFITVRDLRTTPAEVWKALPEEQEMVVTHNGKPIALLTPISDSELEETVRAVRRARAANAVKRMREAAAQRGLSEMTMEEIEEEIQGFRKSKKRR